MGERGVKAGCLCVNKHMNLSTLFLKEDRWPRATSPERGLQRDDYRTVTR